MTAAALLGLVAIAATALFTVSRVRAPADRLGRSELATLSAINDTAAAHARGYAQLLVALGTINPDARGAAVAAAAATAGVQDSAWNRFVAGAEPAPAVQDLIDQYTKADQDGRTLGARLVASNPGDPDFQSNLATEQAMFEHEADVLQQLRRIYVPLATGSIASVTARADGSRFWVLTAFGIALVVTLVASVIIYRNARQDERRQTQARADRAIATRRSDLETRLQRGL